MRITYDACVDAAYIYLTSETLRVGRDSVSCEAPEGAGGVVVLDWPDGKIVGLEVLDGSKRLHRDLLHGPSNSGTSPRWHLVEELTRGRCRYRTRLPGSAVVGARGESHDVPAQ